MTLTELARRVELRVTAVAPPAADRGGVRTGAACSGGISPQTNKCSPANAHAETDQLVAPTQRRVAAGHLDVGMRPVTPVDHVDAPEHLVNRDVPHHIRVL